MLQRPLGVFRLLKSSVRNAPWVMIAISVHVIVIAVLSVVYIAHELADDGEDMTNVNLRVPQAPPLVLPEPERPVRDLVPLHDEAELVEFNDQIFILNTSEPEDFTRERGDPSAVDDPSAPLLAGGNTGIGVGQGGISGAQGPGAYPSRGKGGPGSNKPGSHRRDPAVGTEKAVLEGLRWLARHQNDDGSWGAATLRQRCDGDHPCISADASVSANYDEGLTGLALLAFLGAGISHDSKVYVADTQRGRKYVLGETVKRGLMWLRNRQQPDGSFSGGRAFLYNEALATMAMTEAYGLSGNKYFKPAAELGVQFLVEAQKVSPIDDGPWGWRYESKAHLDAAFARGEIDDATHFVEKSDADISVTCWVIMALKSAQLSGLDVPDAVMQGGLRYAQSVAAEHGLSGYARLDQAGRKVEGPGDEFTYHTGTMSALNMLVRTFVAHDLDDPFLEQAAAHIAADLPAVSKDRLSVDYYYWYYASLALNQFDGPDSPRNAGRTTQKYWGPWQREMERALLALQDDGKRGTCARGGWLVGDRWSQHGHALYSTAINTLTLEVYYRYANAFGAGRERASAATKR